MLEKGLLQLHRVWNSTYDQKAGLKRMLTGFYQNLNLPSRHLSEVISDCRNGNNHVLEPFTPSHFTCNKHHSLGEFRNIYSDLKPILVEKLDSFRPTHGHRLKFILFIDP